ncbi:MAG TPA: hypothetical protein VFX93_13550, partial [Xanthomonadaceae bacterium]|nr:hypothetical protein [Xanthomonadaceae bacterium]
MRHMIDCQGFVRGDSCLGWICRPGQLVRQGAPYGQFRASLSGVLRERRTGLSENDIVRHF